MPTRLLILVLALGLTACNPKAIPTVIFPAKPELPELPETPPPPAEIFTATVNVFARDIVNPDPNGVASPVQVRVFTVADQTDFSGVSFEEIFGFVESSFALKPKLMKTLRPGSVASVDFDLLPEHTAVAIAVAFRDIGRTEWLRLVPVDGSKSVSINFVLSEFTVVHESSAN